MKKTFSLIILCCFSLYANISSLNAQQEIISIAENKIEEARLLENYIKRYVIRIRSMENQYPSMEKEYIQKTLEDIERVLLMLENIQRWIYSISESNILMNGVINYMKELNTQIQSMISDIQKQERERLQASKDIYISTVSKIHTLTNKIIDIYSRHYLGQNVLSEKDREIIAIIIQLREKNKLLLRFESQSFLSVEQMKNYLQKTISSIRGDIIELRRQRSY